MQIDQAGFFCIGCPSYHLTSEEISPNSQAQKPWAFNQHNVAGKTNYYGKKDLI